MTEEKYEFFDHIQNLFGRSNLNVRLRSPLGDQRVIAARARNARVSSAFTGCVPTRDRQHLASGREREIRLSPRVARGGAFLQTHRESAVTRCNSDSCERSAQAQKALAYLERALEIIDSLNSASVTGARIQHAIDTLKDEF